jgi:peptide/nickel transport system substrate-binding protein
MHTHHIRRLLDQARTGALSRRQCVQRLLGLGLGLPVAGSLLMHAGVARSQPAFQYKPTRRGGGGTLRIIRADAATLLNPHFATGLKDNFACRIFYEPLAEWDADANLVPVLAAAIPSRENGGLSADGRSVTWTLKKGVTWHDGAPFTADDVLFNAQYASDPATAAVTAADYAGLRLEKLDSHTVRVQFDKPSPFWPALFSSAMLVPRHRFASTLGARSREAPENVAPVGTGPYRHGEFRPGDVLRAELYPGYHQPLRPHFDRLELKGGGDGLSAARAVLQTGDYDLAAGVVADDDLLRRMEAAGKGRVVSLFGSSTTAIFLNAADPAQELDGERAHAKSRHPLWSDPALRRAFGLLIDREGIQRHVFGRQGVATGNWINNPPRYRSSRIVTEFNIDKARQLLDAAGWKPGADGVRTKNGRRLSVVFQGSSGGITEKYMAVIKSAAEKAGFAVELKIVLASVFFSSDTANPDTYGKFNADIQTYNWSSGSPDPQALALSYVSWEVASRANKWLGANMVRWQSAEYDALYRSAEAELDPVRRAALFVRMNELIADAGYAIPILARPSVRAVANHLRLPLSPWRTDTATLAEWYREG